MPGAVLENTNAVGPDTAPSYAEHEPFTASIVVRNPHDRAVKVERLDASCTCMHLKLAEEFILPHQTTTLAISVDNRNRSGPQHMGVSIYLTDPELEAIDVQVWWRAVPDVAVDAIGPQADPLARPTDIAWQDVYKFVQNERPDELHRLRKRIRVQGRSADFAVLGVDYGGEVWAFAPQRQSDGSWLITATARDPAGRLAEKTYDETVTVRTNDPDKPTFKLTFVAIISSQAGRQAIDPLAPPP
jgi:hypothetical protein